MEAPSTHEITQLLIAWNDGDRVALEKLIPLVYTELRRIARRYKAAERRWAIQMTNAAYAN